MNSLSIKKITQASFSCELAVNCMEDWRPSAFIRSDYPHKIVDHNSLFSELFAFKSDELRGSSLRLIFGPRSDAKRLQSLILSDSGQPESFVFYRKDGEAITCLVCGHQPSSSFQQQETNGSAFNLTVYLTFSNFPGSNLVLQQSQRCDDGKLAVQSTHELQGTDAICDALLFQDTKTRLVNAKDSGHLQIVSRSGLVDAVRMDVKAIRDWPQSKQP